MAPSSLTYAQAQALKIAPRITAALSMVGSASIMYSVVRESVKAGDCCNCLKGRNNNTKQSVLGQSLLLGMSLLDFLSSFSYVLGDVAFPEPKGQGNQATCNFQGFLCNLQVGAALYSGFLAWYYCLFIRYHWNHYRLRRWFEPSAHLISCALPLATAITSVVKGLYNPHWIRCYIAGPGSNPYFWGFFYAPIWASMLCGSIAMLLIFCTVRRTEARSLRHTFTTQSSRFGSSALNSGLMRRTSQNSGVMMAQSSSNELSLEAAPKQRRSTLQRRASLAELPKSRRVAYQGFCYTGAFILCYVFPTTSRIWSNVADTPTPYAIKILATTMVGTQGLFNCLVYFIQPRVHNWWATRQQRRREQQRQQQQSTGTAGTKSERESVAVVDIVETSPKEEQEEEGEPQRQFEEGTA